MAVRVGVIGVGYLGKHHARIFSGLEDVELVGVADINETAASGIAQTYNCRAFSDYAEMIGLCDAVSIVTPTTTHHAVAMDCISAGKDLLIEKPITAGIDEAREVVAAAERGKLILQVGHLERYNPGVIAAAGMITAPRFIESERLSPFMGRAGDVDVTLDLMIHDIDIVLSLVDSRLSRMSAIGESVITERIDVAKAWLEFENGCKALITASRLSPEKVRTLRVFQRDAYISIDYQKQELRRFRRKGTEITSEVIQPENREPLKEELQDFIGCVRYRRKPAVSGTEAMNALDVALKITDMLKD
ncbi:MAG: Gfo/Idh/MocA family oxidoreductase [Nitrospiraceae bacterium]|nr:Gfo/Idh/MocA family oxidoreductase [Nitrospiraceae bacterium]